VPPHADPLIPDRSWLVRVGREATVERKLMTSLKILRALRAYAYACDRFNERRGMITWVLVGDAGRARLFEAMTATGALSEIAAFVHPESRLHANETASDEPGVSHDRAGPGVHAMSKRVDHKSQEATRFAADLASALRLGREKHKFERLYLVAPPRFLGELRKQLDRPTLRLMAAALDKDLTALSPEDIRGHLPQRL
jgi:protein required for attachment to host cells